MRNITQEQLKHHLHYDPTTGQFTWIVPTNKKIRAGAVAGNLTNHGYIEIGFMGSGHYAHRLAFLFMEGRYPDVETDHKNGLRHDNRWENLRSTTNMINQQNRREAQKNSTTALLGVLIHKSGRFMARIRVDGKNKYLGLFYTPEEAHSAYLKEKRISHEGCTI